MYRDGPEFDILFHRDNGMTARQTRIARAAAAVDALTESEILSRSDEELVAAIQAQLSVVVPVLKRDDISFERKMKTISRRDMWGDQATVEVPVFYFDVPYTGEDAIFAMQPNTYSSNRPRGQARRNMLRISVVGEEDATKLQQEVQSTLDNIEQHLGWHREMWSGLEMELAQSAQAQLAQRRQKLKALGQAEAGLAGMGFKPKGG